MNVTVPFSKEIPFKSSIAEICSISLEEDVSINDKEILGDFIVSGEYKNLDVNIDTLPFNHVVPFSLELSDNIDIDTLKYEIEDFTYEVINSDTLKVDILFHAEADEIRSMTEDLFIKEEEDILEEKEELLDREEENIITLEKNEKEDEQRDEDKNILLNNNLEEDFITYHVHIVKINETLESISSLYNISKEDLCELNDVNTISIGDKLVIPDIINEE